MPIPFNQAPKGWYKDKYIAKIQQSEIAFTQKYLNIIASSGAGPCVVFILVDTLTQQGFMTHLFSSAEISPYSVGGQWLLKRCIEQYKNGLVDCYLIGGYSIISYFLIQSIESFLENLGQKIEIKNIYKHLHHNWVSNVVFNFESNALFSYEKHRDQSPTRKLDITQAFISSFTHLIPTCLLLEYEDKNFSKQNTNETIKIK